MLSQEARFTLDDDLTEPSERLLESDGVTRRTVSQRSSCSQQGGLTLMATSQHTEHAARKRELKGSGSRFVVALCRGPGPAVKPPATGALIEAGLFILVVSTAWAIASVSVWWVPVYLHSLVVIFVTSAKPATHRYPRQKQVLPMSLLLSSILDQVYGWIVMGRSNSAPSVDPTQV